MLEFIRCKRIGTIFIVKLAGEGYFTASTDKFSGWRGRMRLPATTPGQKRFADNGTKD
jgi:hypothetical protein